MINTFEAFLLLVDRYGRTSSEVLEFVKKHGDYLTRDAKAYYKTHKEYFYLITFTIDPKKHDVNDVIFQDHTEEYIIKVCKNAKGQNIHISKEHADSNCHWHVSLKTTKPIKYSKFRHYKLTIGNVDISRSKQDSQENSINYISKESMPTKIN